MSSIQSQMRNLLHKMGATAMGGKKQQAKKAGTKNQNTPAKPKGCGGCRRNKRAK